MENIINSIKTLEIDHLTELELENFLPSLGMNDEILSQMPPHLNEYYGKGLKFWQYPNQLSKYLKFLSTKDINSYLEIGCRWGGTFIVTSEFLKLKSKNVDLYCCDIIDKSDILIDYTNFQDFNYLKMSSFDLNSSVITKDIDLILIDGDHSYFGVKKDFEVSMSFNPKYVVFHDIASSVCDDVVKFWGEVKQHYKHYEFTDQYDNVNGDFLGIGVIEIY